MRRLLGVIGAFFVACQSASAADLSVRPDPSWFTGYYVGVGGFGAHHTGYAPNTTFNSESYATGGKLFAGYRYFSWAQVEVSYHYLGEVSFDQGLAIPTREKSHAIGASWMFVSYPLSAWAFPTIVPVRILARLGMAYKDITMRTAAGDFHEGVAAGYVGVGLEADITKRLFLRMEYEFMTPAIGNTRNVINVMHTPLSMSLGMKF